MSELIYKLLLIGPLLVLFLFLIYHSLKTAGKRTALLFFGLGLIFASLRELILGLDQFSLYSGSFKIGPLSPGIAFGWVFAFYLGHYFATRLTANTHLEKNILVKVFLGTCVVIGISFIMETTGPVPPLEWWSWNPGLLASLPSGSLILGAPYFVFAGWGITGCIFLSIFYLVQELGFKPKVIIAITCLFLLFLANFMVGNFYIMHPPSVPEFTSVRLIFTSLYLGMLAVFIKKRRTKATYENIFLNIAYTVFEGVGVYTLVYIILNPSSMPLQISYLAITLIVLGVFAILIVKQGFYINSIANKKYKGKPAV
jgi:hypothetical protein